MHEACYRKINRVSILCTQRIGRTDRKNREKRAFKKESEWNRASIHKNNNDDNNNNNNCSSSSNSPSCYVTNESNKGKKKPVFKNCAHKTDYFTVIIYGRDVKKWKQWKNCKHSHSHPHWHKLGHWDDSVKLNDQRTNYDL